MAIPRGLFCIGDREIPPGASAPVGEQICSFSIFPSLAGFSSLARARAMASPRNPSPPSPSAPSREQEGRPSRGLRVTRLMSSSAAIRARALRKEDYGCPLPTFFHPGAEGVRQRVLLETLGALEEASATASYHVLAQHNLARWNAQAIEAGRKERPDAREERTRCTVLVLPGDWGAVTLQLTQRFGETFACLNMANAYGPGGGYTDGMVAQEENMFRRTDCHFALDPQLMDKDRLEYIPQHSRLLNAVDGRVYLDTESPRVCIRGPEDRSQSDLGYAWLNDDEVFPFYELRAAAMDLRDGSSFDSEKTARRIRAQLDTLIDKGVRYVVLSAFGCGAFRNPAHRVSAIYRQELECRANSFSVVAFAIFHAGYGPNNFAPFENAFAGWPGPTT